MKILLVKFVNGVLRYLLFLQYFYTILLFVASSIYCALGVMLNSDLPLRTDCFNTSLVQEVDI